MAVLTGFFQRGATYYLRVVLPKNHPLKSKYQNGGFVSALGRCSRREAATLGTIKRAEVLGGQPIEAIRMSIEATEPPSSGPHYETFTTRWKASKPRSTDSLNTCLHSVSLSEAYTGNPAITLLTREQGDGFRTWLQHPDRKTTSKTAGDRLTWVKSVLKFAARDLGLIDRNPWEGLDISFNTTNKRRPWTDGELKTFFTQPLHTAYNSSGAFKPYAGVSAAILLFTKTNSGGTDQVWFYDMKADGWSLDDQCQPLLSDDKLSLQPFKDGRKKLSKAEHWKSSLPDVLERWGQRDAGERQAGRTAQSFCVPNADIAGNGYDLSIRNSMGHGG